VFCNLGTRKWTTSSKSRLNALIQLSGSIAILLLTLTWRERVWSRGVLYTQGRSLQGPRSFPGWQQPSQVGQHHQQRHSAPPGRKVQAPVSTRMIAPLEFKTGKPHQSHRAQVASQCFQNCKHSCHLWLGNKLDPNFHESFLAAKARPESPQHLHRYLLLIAIIVHGCPHVILHPSWS
jgi:hypothetical protein